MYQTTIRRAVTCSGIGLHGGKQVHMALHPAPADSGIVFHIHTDQGVRRVSPSPDAVMTTELATTLGTPDNGRGKAAVSTVEHVLATVRGLSIDNLAIHVEGGEIPIMDGSASAFVNAFAEAGIRTLPAPRRVLRVTRPFELADGRKHIRVVPHAGFRVDCTIDFPHPSIGRQRLVMDVTPASFARIAKARTFGFLKDVEYMHSHGLALGGSLDNAVVLDDSGVVNPEGLRAPDEFVRHKVLDFIGDMAMLRLPLQGSFELACSGHQFNNVFLRALDASRTLQEVETRKTGNAGHSPDRSQDQRKPLLGVPSYTGSLTALA